jgi:hypothetical protein
MAAMDLVIRFLSHILVPLFFIGMAGSSVVIIISFFEDMQELIDGEDDEGQSIESV